MGVRFLGLTLLALLLTACTTRRAARPAFVSMAGTPADIQSLVRLALTLDAAADRAADTLYTPDAIVIGNARVRFASPRFAGISYGGRVAAAAAAVTVEGRWAWAMVDYRWMTADGRRAEAGRATFLCERRDAAGGWKIVHVHSSQLLPWDR
ncbi:MAG: nuclear transport factor 2 family protein [Gemmatimonadales bacterium]